jgi:hypothetical protein
MDGYQLGALDATAFANEFQALTKLIGHDEVCDARQRRGSASQKDKAVSFIHAQETQVDTSDISKPTPGGIGPKDLLNVKVAAPQGVELGRMGFKGLAQLASERFAARLVPCSAQGPQGNLG